MGIKEEYLERKEESRYQMELQKAVAAQRQRAAVEDHLEKMQVVAEYQLDEHIREKHDEAELRASKERAELDLQLHKAAAERARELENLEYLRGKKNLGIPRRLDGSAHNFP